MLDIEIMIVTDKLQDLICRWLDDNMVNSLMEQAQPEHSKILWLVYKAI